MEKKIAQATFTLIVLLSILRIGCPYFLYSVFREPGLMVGIIIAYFLHRVVRPYVGMRLFSVVQLDEETQFRPLKRWMVPRAGQPITTSGYEEIAKSATPPTKAYLREIAKTQGYVSYYDYINASLFEEQYWRRKCNEEKTEKAVAQFLNQED